MSHLFWKNLVLLPVFLGANALASSSVMAAELLNSANSAAATNSSDATTALEPAKPAKTEENQVLVSQAINQDSMSQVTSVSQFSDVQPTDWAFQALQSLVERYGCIAGYPNGTYRGNRALTRYEFAAGLNACLDRVNELIATATADLVTKQDLATLQRLQEEFSAELATLRGRVDSLEARTAELEANQFSTTTKLVGEAIFVVTDTFGENNNNKTVFQDRVRLDLQTSFTGRDTLHTRIAAGNANLLRLPGNSFESTQTFNLGNTGSNSAIIDWLSYYFPLGNSQVYIAATGGIHSDYAPTVNPYFEGYDSGNGALSTFASESPIYRIGGGAGGGLNFVFGSGNGGFQPSITLGYLASQANNPAPRTGLFEGNYAALAQLNLNVGDRLSFAATYVHGYHDANTALFDFGGLTSGVVGTAPANFVGGGNPYNSNSYGVAAAFKPSDKLSISGFLMYSDINSLIGNSNDEVWSYGVGVALPDFGKKGNLLGIFAGAQPYLGSISGDRPYHIEGFYKYRVSDNISITPGVIWLTSPGQVANSDDALIGTLRTTFTF
ncbi:iron uptake porin [Calothrix sp. FACHB-1219]|uniref:iron uptake porin n=1 Tax=unclassified Calothrix TaxID=2619626 RepID=UPI001682165C|nr:MULTISPECIES: iron uptake porin [unclassified Calothrix]MBD2204689.1 iron uptake porin [Calothrix sp. FACHB-168]MBD2216799.1 iron uptake porin [Calothrix sp. FACHB-1219]